MQPILHGIPSAASAPYIEEQTETSIAEPLTFRLPPHQEQNPFKPQSPNPNISHCFLEKQKVQVSSFRADPMAPCDFKISEAIEEFYLDQIDDMPNYPTEHAFQPHLNKGSSNSPIHQLLGPISREFLDSHKHTYVPLAEKMRLYEEFVAQFIYAAILRRSNGKALSEQPFFECLEIALRAHLFNELIARQNTEIKHLFSAQGNFLINDLAERETALETFVTKNGFFINPDPNFFFLLFPCEYLQSPIQLCISEADQFPLHSAIASNEELINKTIIKLGLVKPSKIATSFEYILRQNLSNTLISKQVLHFKEQYDKIGTISLDDFNQASDGINNFLSSDGKFLCTIPVKYEILVKIFEVSQGNLFPFQQLRSKIQEDKAAISAPKGLFSFLSRESRHCAKKSQLLDNQLATIAWAEREWTLIINPPENIPSHDFAVLEEAPSAPPDFDVEDLVMGQPLYPLDPVETTVDPEDDWELVNVSPAVKSVRPPAPTPTEPVVAAPVQSFAPIQQLVQPSEPAAPVRIYATDFNIPIVSYINLAFADRFQTIGDDSAVWNSLPGIIQRDALRHACHLHIHSGKAEDVAIRLFKMIPEIQKQLYQLEYNSLLPRARTQLSPEFIKKGEELLNIYYSSDRNNFPRELQSLPRENLFYKYVYEMAVAAGVNIESWDHHFAENNWNKVTMMNLTVQALERCLHTDTQ